MTFDNSYFEDEVREGFYIPGMIKRSWATQLDILEKVIEICDRHNLKWFAGYGTLLGAVRHRGFIPWDDDLDICMIREDYNKFVDYVEKELPSPYEVMTIYNNKEYFNFLTRILNHNLIDTTESFLDENCGFPFASGIDVFPLDYLYPDDEIEEKRRLKAQKLWALITDNKRENTIENGYELLRQIEELSGVKIKPNKYVANSLYKLLDKVFTEAPKTGATHVTLMPVWAENKAQKFPISIFDDLISVPFENTHILIPASYNKVLKLIYGNWEKANRKGGLHDYPFYHNQEEQLEEHYGKLPYKFYYSHTIPKVCNINLSPNTILPIIDTLNAACDMIQYLMSNNSFQDIPELLENSQDLAIKAGTSIEEIYGNDGNICVSKLEEFCEQIYLLNEAIINEESNIEAASLKSAITSVKEEYQNLYNKDDILIVTFRSLDWDFVDAIYKNALANNKSVKVLNVSYFIKKMNGNFDDEHKDNSGYPKYVDVIDSSEYGFAYHRPKEIIIQNPFDQYASAISINPMFYSTNLKDYTDKLTYLQSFNLYDIDEADEKGMRNAKYFIISPGIFCSDEIIVDTEATRDLYIKIITENTDLKKEDIASKILTREERIIKDQTIKENNLSSAPSEDEFISNKSIKNMIFYIGFADIYENKTKFIDKLERTLNILKVQDSLHIIWAQDKDLDNHIKTFAGSLYEQFAELRSSFINDQTDFIETDVWTDIIENVDAFYGSAGYVMNLAVLKRIPTMKWNIEC